MVRGDEIQVLVANDDEDWLNGAFLERPAPLPCKPSRQRKEIGIDDILKDRLKKRKAESKGQKGQKGRKWKAQKGKIIDFCRSSHDSDSEDDTYIAVARVVEECQRQVSSGTVAAAEASKWGRQLFASCKESPNPPFVGSDGVLGRLLQIVPVKDPLELLSGNHLLTAAALWGELDELTALWIFHHLCFSRNQAVEESACDILCRLARCAPESQPASSGLAQSSVSSFCGWRPEGEVFLSAFSNLGYVEQGEASAPIVGGVRDAMAPRSLGSLLQFLAACSKTPGFAKFSVTEVERLVVCLVEFIADRQLQGLLHLVFRCLEALVDHFKEEDWPKASENITFQLAGLCPTSHVFVKAYLTSHARIGQLQNRMMLLLLSKYAKRDVSSAKDVVSIFKDVSFKKAASFVDLYHQLVLADLWLWRTPSVKSGDKAARQAWLSFLRSCSSQIHCSDVRLYATKVRNWAAFLCQKYLCVLNDLSDLDVSKIPEDEYL